MAKILRETQHRGYAIPDDAYSKAVYDSATSGFAVAVMADGVAIASINLMFLTSTIALGEAVANFLPALRQAAAQIGHTMERDLSMK